MNLHELGRARRVGLRVKHRQTGELGRLTGDGVRSLGEWRFEVEIASGKCGWWFEDNIERLGAIDPFPKEGGR